MHGLLDFSQRLKRLEPLGAGAELGEGLRAAEHQHAEQADFGGGEQNGFGERVFVFRDAALGSGEDGGEALRAEAVEGTDAAIRRGAELARRGAVVVKVAKPGQDLRFDVPAVGPGTIRLMAETHAAVLALEAGRTLVLERESTISLADMAGIAVVAIEAEPDASGVLA